MKRLTLATVLALLLAGCATTRKPTRPSISNPVYLQISRAAKPPAGAAWLGANAAGYAGAFIDRSWGSGVTAITYLQAADISRIDRRLAPLQPTSVITQPYTPTARQTLVRMAARTIQVPLGTAYIPKSGLQAVVFTGSRQVTVDVPDPAGLRAAVSTLQLTR